MTGRPPTEPDPTPSLCVVCPAYNEQGAIARTVGEVERHVRGVVGDATMIVVNDGSKDRTGAILDELAAQRPWLRVVHQANAGHGPALRRGLDEARAQWLFLIDSDDQIDLASFARLWDATRTHDVVMGVRSVRHDPGLRLVLTRVVRWSLWAMFGVRLRDANVPCKLVRAEVWRAAAGSIPTDTLAPSIFLAVHAARHGARIAEIDVVHRERTTGVVSIRRWKLLKFCARGLRQLVGFRLRGA